ncbi:hypothetical protein HGRIS_012060 [Hohenbuehelia grisea]|uniref:Cerato-platanin n=1 Tax=Hohenbuehelia grisea TaxID=104357 RepID=A0ABR3IR39_9AGAR
MKFTYVLAPLALLAGLASADKTTVGYDSVYGEKGRSMNTVSCSDGSHGLTKKYPTLGSVPAYVGSTYAVGGWNSDKCGTCWKLTYTPAKGKKQTIYMVAVDHANDSFNVSPAAFKKLTGNTDLGRVNIIAEQVGSNMCGM